MRYTLKRLSLATVLILLASLTLLATDIWRHSRRSDMPRVALLQFASTSVMDEGIRGFKDALKENGFEDGRNIRLKFFNSEGDIANANSIAREMANAPYEMLVTFSTPCLQAVCTANRNRKVPHVFGLVADPGLSGVGINPANWAEHPPYLTGLATLLPVEECFQTMRRLYPALKRVGVAWNSGEMNSEIYVKRARKVAESLGVELVEATVENSAGVTEAVNSLIARDIDAIWVGGDSTISANISSVIGAAKQARIPVVTITPAKPERGTLMDYGVSFYEAGGATGDMAAEILRGANIAKMPPQDVKQYASRVILFNTLALKNLKAPWRIPEEERKLATVWVDETGVHKAETRRKRFAKP